MKKLAVFAAVVICLLTSVNAQRLPERPSGPVADFADVLDASTRQRISMLAQALWEQAGFGLVVVTIPSLGEESIEEYATRLYEKWGVGKRGSDEGALVLLSLSPRRVRIEVGYGAEGYLNDAKTGRILDQYGVPHFRSSDYARGLVDVSEAVAGAVVEEKNVALSAPTRSVSDDPTTSTGALSITQLIIIFILASLLLGTRIGRTLLWALILSSITNGGRGGYRGGSFGGGFGGGGFGGGFGGGRSGGGGSSRSF